MNVETFFKNLPADEFQIFETELREALIHVAAKAKDLGLPGGRFPLHAWIDRRLGEEIAAQSDSRGYLEVSLIASGWSGGTRVDEAFFSGLKEDSFSKEEGALREAIFDFLASWQSPKLATSEDLSKDANVSACVEAFLPSSVPLADWIERRIGGEIELQEGVVQVLPDARKIVSDKYQALLAQRSTQQVNPVNPGFTIAPWGTQSPQVAETATTVPARFPQPPLQGKGKGKPPTAPLPAVENKEQWLQALPQNELTGEEVNLRQVLLDWLDAWARRPQGKGPKGAPLLGDAMNDTRVTQGRMRLLPRNVSLKEWIEARIGGELELRENQRGQVEVVRGGEANQDPNGILDSLPEDALNEQELELRTLVLGMLSSSRCRLPQLSQNPGVMAAKRKFLPDEVPLSEWIDRRIGGEVEITADHWVRTRSNGNAEEPAAQGPAASGPGGFKGESKGKGKNGKGKGDADSSRTLAENFFKSLPAMSFTEAEEALRDAILCFLENWVEEEAPTLSKAMLDPDVRRCKLDVLPKGNVVSLKEWIERRLGGELEILRNETGNLVIGICGDPEPAKREAADDWEQGPGKVPRVQSE